MVSLKSLFPPNKLRQTKTKRIEKPSKVDLIRLSLSARPVTYFGHSWMTVLLLRGAMAMTSVEPMTGPSFLPRMVESSPII